VRKPISYEIHIKHKLLPLENNARKFIIPKSRNGNLSFLELGTRFTPIAYRSRDMELQKRFGANVRHYRKARRNTLEGLASDIGISRESLGKIERGVAAPMFSTAEKIARALEVPAPVLFGAGVHIETGERARLLTDINLTLSKMNDEQLARVAKMLRAFIGV